MRRSSTVNGARVQALRYAREMVSDMRWRGMTVPPLYIRMAEEFQGLVRSGAYAAWVASQDSLGVGYEGVGQGPSNPD
jgi:hypothetical protein